jgi:GTP-binding protein Era
MGILNGPDHQICMFDTPGLIDAPKDALQAAITRSARQACNDGADALVFVVEPEMPDDSMLNILSNIARSGPPVIVAQNKADLPAQTGLREKVLDAYKTALKPAAAFNISARTGSGVPQLREAIIKLMPLSPALHDPDALSDRWERFFVCEIIREQLFAIYDQELPHASAVVIDTYRERPGRKDEVAATLYIERDGQKGIILGKNGRTLRELTKQAQTELEKFLGRKVELTIWVKVRKNWRKDPQALKEFGYLPS